MLKPKTGYLLTDWLRNQCGMAATEFAILMPVMLLLFCGVIEGSEALSQNRRAAQAANVLADLTAQESDLLYADADDLFSGVEQIIDDRSAAISVRLVSVIANPGGEPMVHWSRDNLGRQPYSPGAPYLKLPSNSLLDPGASLIVAEISYPWASRFGGHVFKGKTMEEVAIRWPRRAFAVELCARAGSCTVASDVAYSG